MDTGATEDAASGRAGCAEGSAGISSSPPSSRVSLEEPEKQQDDDDHSDCSTTDVHSQPPFGADPGGYPLNRKRNVSRNPLVIGVATVIGNRLQ
jgi:hypothetical protein